MCSLGEKLLDRVILLNGSYRAAWCHKHVRAVAMQHEKLIATNSPNISDR